MTLPLKTNRRVLTWLCMCPANEATEKWKKIAYTSLSITAVLLIVCAFLASVAYFGKFASTDLEEALYALFQIIGAVSLLFAIKIAYFSRNKIDAIFENLTKIYRKSENRFELHS